ncbi:unnamed protein product [Lymnaea stagnalis]|uniref:Uncharacterized protein n=1 Tax=Lymnaea stagnalis TaxID=6523 RepID=A0AAV2HZK0_LYMST
MIVAAANSTTGRIVFDEMKGLQQNTAIRTRNKKNSGQRIHPEVHFEGASPQEFYCKNKTKYVSFPSIKLECLPCELRHESVLRFLSLLGTLTCSVEVRKSRKGTGSLIPRSLGQIRRNAAFDKLTNGSCERGRADEYLDIYIITSREIISNEEDAASSTVYLYYFNKDCTGREQVRGSSVVFSPIPGDGTVTLVCQAPSSLASQIQKKSKEFLTSLEDIPLNIQKYLVNIGFMVSHPHGQEQHISYGEYKLSKFYSVGSSDCGSTSSHSSASFKNQTNASLKAIVYSFPSCGGSIGAPIITFKVCKDRCQPEMWLHKGTNRKTGENVSEFKVSSENDDANPEAHSELKSAIRHSPSSHRPERSQTPGCWTVSNRSVLSILNIIISSDLKSKRARRGLKQSRYEQELSATHRNFQPKLLRQKYTHSQPRRHQTNRVLHQPK